MSDSHSSTVSIRHEARLAHEPGERRIGGEEREHGEGDQDRLAADAVGERARDRQPDEIRRRDRHGHEQRVGFAELQHAAAEGRRVDGDEIERDRRHDDHRHAAEHERPVGGERLVDLGRRRMDLSRGERLGLLERAADHVEERHDRAADEERDAPAPVGGGLGDMSLAMAKPSSAANTTATCWLADCQLT